MTPRILCIETASTNCSVALSTSEGALILKEDNSNSYSHGERLHTYIDTVMQEAGLGFDQLDAVAVSKGPGSYTGLRIGVSAAKGLCFAQDKPLIAIPTLSSLAAQVEATDGLVVSMLDARRMEVYSGAFEPSGAQIRETRAEILDADSFDDYLEQGTVTFIGSGVAKFQEICLHPNARFVPNTLPSARELVPLALEQHKKATYEDVAYFEPYYLKDFKLG